jgi:uncharacterized protein YaaW (UPF0174 family)
MQELESLLQQATGGQLEPLVKILDTYQCRSSNPDDIVRGIKWLHRNIFEDFYRDVFGESESYRDILESLANHLEIAISDKHDCENIESLICQQVVGKYWDSLNSAEKAEFARRIDAVATDQPNGSEWKRVGGLVGALALANAGGFTTYILASSALAGITGFVGLTLPFAVYTSMSAALSVVLGPIGWIGAAIYGMYKLSGTNYQKLLPAVLYIAALRYELKVRPNRVVGRVVIPHDFESKRGKRLL